MRRKTKFVIIYPLISIGVLISVHYIFLLFYDPVNRVMIKPQNDTSKNLKFPVILESRFQRDVADPQATVDGITAMVLLLIGMTLSLVIDIGDDLTP